MLPLLRALRRLSPLLMLAPLLSVSAAEPLHVAVAANFRDAAEALAERHSAAGGDTVTISSASTGVLAAQLRSGAPFDLLLAADATRPLALHHDGFAAEPPTCYAVGQLVLLGAKRGDINAALGDPNMSIAIANPATAPYGAAALGVLQRDAFASASGRRILRGANVLQAFQYFSSGAASLALVARSLSPTSGALIPGDWHPPIEQYAVINARSPHRERARVFLDFISGSEAATLLSERGYLPCS